METTRRLHPHNLHTTPFCRPAYSRMPWNRGANRGALGHKNTDFKNSLISSRVLTQARKVKHDMISKNTCRNLRLRQSTKFTTGTKPLQEPVLGTGDRREQSPSAPFGSPVLQENSKGPPYDPHKFRRLSFLQCSLRSHTNQCERDLC